MCATLFLRAPRDTEARRCFFVDIDVLFLEKLRHAYHVAKISGASVGYIVASVHVGPLYRNGHSGGFGDSSWVYVHPDGSFYITSRTCAALGHALKKSPSFLVKHLLKDLK